MRGLASKLIRRERRAVDEMCVGECPTGAEAYAAEFSRVRANAYDPNHPERGWMDHLGGGPERVALLWMWAHDWKRGGMPSFQVSPSLGQVLSATDYGSGQIAGIIPPFDACYLVLPGGDVARIGRGFTPGRHAEFYYALLDLRVSNPDLYQPAQAWWLAGDTNPETVREVSTSSGAGAALELALNTLLYIDTRADPALPKEPRGSHPPRRGMVYRIGTGVRLPAPVRAALARGQHMGGRLIARHLVRGHWKRQVCGPDGEDRKTIRIAPYWRGPEAGELAIRDFEVDECPEGSTN